MSEKRLYEKPALTYVEQVERLQERGMIVSAPKSAAFYLEHLNYYRLRGYWLYFESDLSSHQFKPNTSFDKVLGLYLFDRELRLLLMDAIERIEVSARAHWAYELGHQYGAYAFLDPTIASNPSRWEQNLSTLSKEVSRSDEVFIEHLKNTYREEYPPIWAACEVMSLGLLSRWYDNLKPLASRTAIARPYGVDHTVLASWLNHISSVRNYCAHHARLWNRQFVRTPALPKSKPAKLAENFVQQDRRLYNTLVILLYWMDCLSPGHRWRERLKALLQNYLEYLPAMGFPVHWSRLPIWSAAA
jgi:abortive infection bacteriophage resistance protein